MNEKIKNKGIKWNIEKRKKKVKRFFEILEIKFRLKRNLSVIYRKKVTKNYQLFLVGKKKNLIKCVYRIDKWISKICVLEVEYKNVCTHPSYGTQK